MQSMLTILTALVAAVPGNAAGSRTLYENLNGEDLKQIIARHPVAFIPAGIAEWHGEQSACGLDALKAETLCHMAAENLGGVCFPTV